MNMKTMTTLRPRSSRNGNILVGCLVALAIALVILIAGVVIVVFNWRGWTASGMTHLITTGLDQTQISQIEKDEIIAHIDTLVTRFENKDVTIEQLANVIEEIVESPLLPSAMVMSADAMYIENSELDEAEKEQSKIELLRFAQGLFDESIEPEAFNDVLEPISTDSPDDDDIVLNISFDANGQTSTTYAIRSADEVSSEDLRAMIANAKAKADEAGITETPEPIDLSNEIAIAIALALDEDPTLWLPEGVEYVPAPVDEDEEDVPADETDEDAEDDSSDDDSDGP
jgi:hypothetical protein